MSIRNRSRSFPQPAKGVCIARLWSNLSAIYTTSYEASGGFVTGQLDTSVDVADLPFLDHTLDISHKKAWTPKLSGVTWGSVNNQGCQFTISNWAVKRPNPVTGLPSLPTPAWTYYTTKAIANANPGKPIVDYPLFLWELREFPRMLRELGDILRKSPGYQDIADFPRKQFLAYYFGWKPLISDLKSLLQIAAVAKDNNRLINDAVKGKKISRKIGNKTIGQFQTSVMTRIPPLSNQDTIMFRGAENWVCTEKAWFSALLKVHDPLPVTDTDPYSIIDSLGLYPSAATLWNAVPWTWLFDWFANIGDILESRQGRIKYSVRNLNIMVQQEYKCKWTTEYIRGGLKLSTPSRQVIYKGRRQPPPAARFAFKPYPMTGIKALILSCITVGKLRHLR